MVFSRHRGSVDQGGYDSQDFGGILNQLCHGVYYILHH